jgi:hypothetical protein
VASLTPKPKHNIPSTVRKDTNPVLPVADKLKTSPPIPLSSESEFEFELELEEFELVDPELFDGAGVAVETVGFGVEVDCKGGNCGWFGTLGKFGPVGPPGRFGFGGSA